MEGTRAAASLKRRQPYNDQLEAGGPLLFAVPKLINYLPVGVQKDRAWTVFLRFYSTAYKTTFYHLQLFKGRRMIDEQVVHFIVIPPGCDSFVASASAV